MVDYGAVVSMILIPDFLVYSAMFYLSFMGVWCSRLKIYIDPAYFLLFLPQAIMYLTFDFMDIPIPERGAFVRLSLFIIPLCFAAVLTSAYWRMKKYE